MLTKIMERKIKARIDAMLNNGVQFHRYKQKQLMKQFGYLGGGIHRRTFILDSNLVMKVEREPALTKLDKEYAFQGNMERINLEIELSNNKITNKNYLDFITLFSLEVSQESIDYFIIKRKFTGQNYGEALNWRKMKNKYLSRRLVPVYGIIRYRNFTITVQDRGIPIINMPNSWNVREMIESDFASSEYCVSDLHDGNIVEMPNGEFKICDTGLCRF